MSMNCDGKTADNEAELTRKFDALVNLARAVRGLVNDGKPTQEITFPPGNDRDINDHEVDCDADSDGEVDLDEDDLANDDEDDNFSVQSNDTESRETSSKLLKKFLDRFAEVAWWSKGAYFVMTTSTVKTESKIDLYISCNSVIPDEKANQLQDISKTLRALAREAAGNVSRIKQQGPDGSPSHICIEVIPGRHYKVRHTLTVYLRRRSFLDGLMPTKCVIRLLDAKSLFTWCGPLVIVRDVHDDYRDIDPADLRIATEYFRWYLSDHFRHLERNQLPSSVEFSGARSPAETIKTIWAWEHSNQWLDQKTRHYQTFLERPTLRCASVFHLIFTNAGQTPLGQVGVI